MARIRKSAVPAGIKKYTFWRIAVYIRLSRDDGNDESLSVTNQRKVILEFIKEKLVDEEYRLVDFYVDATVIIGLNQQSLGVQGVAPV